MKSEIVLEVLPRQAKEKLVDLRAKGSMPAVYYGRKQASTPIAVSAVEFSKVLKKAGESSVVTLKTKEGTLDSLIYDVDRDPVTGAFLHADFYVFEKGQKIKVKIPLEFQGVSPAVKDLGAVLVKVLREVEVEAAPKDLPHVLIVDISKLVSFNSQVTAKDITLAEGVTLIAKPDEVVASVYEPKEEVVEEAPVDLTKIEVEKKGKEPKEGEEGAEAAPAGDKAAAKPAEKK
ncbi:MAG: 50S ribosomal protein L25 [Patescibacteria group bacterium]